jgi:periplasmic divalent cation tolerance protein
MDRYVQVLTTTGRADEAHRISDELLTKRLAACVQVIGPIASRYWWKDELESAEEWLLIAKTRAERFDEVDVAIRAAHTYDVPEVTALRVEAGSPDYLDWIGSVVAATPQ